VPQDGRVSLTIDGHSVDLRVVTLPSVHGESVVMRILDKGSVVMDLDSLGMGDGDRTRFSKAFGQSHGAVLVTGPTGSGKSTTLYAALGVINTPEKNIITIEDPVEYQVGGITQVQTNPKAGLTFANGLRAMMRADPDVIMVGEVRDRETAQIAVEAALTGHLVLTTLHTNDAPGAVSRLIEMGIEPFLVSSAIDAVVAQRLARTLCEYCKKPVRVSAQALRDSGFSADRGHRLLRARRLRALRQLRLQGPARPLRGHDRHRRDPPPGDRARVGRQDLRRRRGQGMTRLRDDGLAKVKLGKTSIAEVSRVTGST
jgi:type IV pilus assembly protein PilB